MITDPSYGVLQLQYGSYQRGVNLENLDSTLAVMQMGFYENSGDLNFLLPPTVYGEQEPFPSTVPVCLYIQCAIFFLFILNQEDSPPPPEMIRKTGAAAATVARE